MGCGRTCLRQLPRGFEVENGMTVQTNSAQAETECSVRKAWTEPKLEQVEIASTAAGTTSGGEGLGFPSLAPS